MPCFCTVCKLELCYSVGPNLLITGAFLVFKKSMLVCDHKRYPAHGQRALDDHSSSMDASIAATMCLGAVHPRVLGIGGYVISLLCFWRVAYIGKV